ncbi:MAG TPA: hypothetical protein VE690_07800 [Rhodopila sp.]|nr:hypothetical protein [Rhodopila sp.]
MTATPHDRLLEQERRNGDELEEDVLGPAEREDAQPKRISVVWFVLCIAVLILTYVSAARAAPPPGTDLDSPTHKWFEAQKSNSGTSCCSISDGHVLDEENIRVVNEHWEVRIRGNWVPVPAQAVIRSPDNPTGKSVAWYSEYNEGHETRVIFYCFLPWRTLL